MPASDSETLAGLRRYGTAPWPRLSLGEHIPAYRFHEFHQERCAICGITDPWLILDHDHVSQLIRGYLCRSCNPSEGMRRATPMPVFAAYRQRNPATIVGFWATHGGRDCLWLFTVARQKQRQSIAAIIESGCRALADLRTLWGRHERRPAPVVKLLTGLVTSWDRLVALSGQLHPDEDPSDRIEACLFYLDMIWDALNRQRGLCSDEMNQAVSTLYRSVRELRHHYKLRCSG